MRLVLVLDLHAGILEGSRGPKAKQFVKHFVHGNLGLENVRAEPVF